MMSACAVDPTLYFASDDFPQLLVDADDRVSPASQTVAELMADEDAKMANLCRYWSTFDEEVRECIGCDERLVPPWLPDQQLFGMNWQDGRLPSPSFSGDHLDRVSQDLWILSPSSLLDVENDDAYGSGTLLTKAAERSAWGSCSSHATDMSTKDRCLVERCLTCESPSVDIRSPATTSGESAELAESTRPDSRPSSRFNSLDDDVDVDQPPARAWKRRRRRRQRRWSRRSSLGTMSRPPRPVARRFSSVNDGAQILRSLLLPGSRRAAYRSPLKSGFRSVSSRSDVVGHAMTGRGDDAIRRQPTRTVSTPLITRRPTSAADSAGVGRRCLEDHCYFNWKQADMIDLSRISREDTRAAEWSTPVS